ncbi:MAG: Fic family protein [Frankiaceae bacterium]|jgi:Fic family protein|nr:Fic family protein [Frankiaceae bacterium]
MTASDEYAIDAARFRDALLEQRAMRLAGGLYHLNQIQLAYNSNRIEGSQLSSEQTRYLFETQTVDGPARADDVVETTNHFRIFDVMLDAVGSPLTAQRIREYHRILKSGTSDSALDWFGVGDWKRVPNVVGGTDTTPPELVGTAIDDLLAQYPGPMAFADICDFHWRFEAIHPFQDGNGRVGRIIAFEQCLTHGIMPFIVLEDDKFFYYRGLREYAAEPGFLRDTFRAFQDRYHATYRQYIPQIPGQLAD